MIYIMNSGVMQVYLIVIAFEKIRKGLMDSSPLFVHRFVRHHGTTHFPVAIYVN
jgi:hypothetical protein